MTSQSTVVLEQSFLRIMRRYGSGVSPEAFIAVLCPMLVPTNTLDKNVLKVPGQSHWRASFSVRVTAENRGVLVRGRTGKFVPHAFGGDAEWREIAKGRIISVDYESGLAEGEVYTGGTKQDLKTALRNMQGNELLEIDQFGAAAKVLSGLSEFELVRQAEDTGYVVRRMPEDMARHLGSYANYDFEFSKKDGTVRKVEVKSLWGTNTRFARLIHSTTTAPKGPIGKWTEEQKRNYYPTSSCKYLTQDIFAVSLFLRTGNIRDFAFARSVPKDFAPYGLPASSEYPEHVNQNPTCEIGDGTWFGSIAEVWDLP